MNTCRKLVALYLAFVFVVANCVISTRALSAPKAMEEKGALAALEERNKEFRSIECEFTRREYSPTFGGVDKERREIAHRVSIGRVSHRENAAWEFCENEVREFDRATGKLKPVALGKEHWVFDAQHFWESDATLKQLRQHRGDESFFGFSIDGMFSPIWIGLGVRKPVVIERDFDVRVVTDARFAHYEVWIEFMPRSQNAKAICSQIVAVYRRPDMLPYAVRINAPNGSDYTTFEFRKIKVNNVFAPPVVAPTVPAGWEVVLADMPKPAEPASNTETAEMPVTETIAPRTTKGSRKERGRLLRRLFRRVR